MVRALFLTLLNASLLGLPLMGAVLLLRRLLRFGVPRRGLYLLWLLVFLRLMLPLQISSPASFYRLLPEQTVAAHENGVPVVVSDNGATVAFPVLVSPPKTPTAPNGDAGAKEDVLPPQIDRRPVERVTVFAAVWASGAVMLCGFGVFCYLLVLKKIREESFFIELPNAKASRAGVYRCGLFHTPVVCGLLRPKIILPMEMDTDQADTLAAVLAHEQAHIRRLDNLWRLLASLTLYLHWFNPLVWVCYCAFIRDMEVSCDERVLAAAKQDIRTQYASALLTLAAAQVNPLYGGMLSFGESGIRERVKHIMSFQRAKLLGLILCAAVVVGLSVVFLTNPSAKPTALPVGNPAASSMSEEQANGDLVFESEPSPITPEFAGVPNPPEPTILPVQASQTVSGAAQSSSEAAAALSGDGVKYQNSEITYVYLLDGENSSYRLIENPADRVNLVLAAAERTSTSGSGQVLIHTKDGKYAWNFDPQQDPALAKLCKTLEKDAPNVAQWFAWMTDRNLIRFDLEGAVTGSIEQPVLDGAIIDPGALSTITDALKHLEVLPAPQLVPEGVNPVTPAGAYRFQLTFGTGTKIVASGFLGSDVLNLSSSDTGPLTICYRAKEQGALDEFYTLTESLYQQRQSSQPTEILCDQDDVLRTHLYDNAEKTYAAYLEGVPGVTHWWSITGMLSDARPDELSALGKPLEGLHTLEITRKSDLSKFVYRLYEYGFTVEGTAVEGKAIAPAYTLPTPEAWALFLQEAEAAYAAAPTKGAYWLGLMSDAKLDTIVGHDRQSGMQHGYRPLKNGGGIDELLRGIAVKTPCQSFDADHPPKLDNNSISVTVRFLNQIEYEMNVTGDSLWITSSDIDYGLQYQLDGTCWFDDLRAYINTLGPDKGMIVNPAAKPVIYLYPERETDVTVELTFDGAFTYTYPSYGDGWHVTAQPDGTLKNLADGSTHYYLFWEGVAAKPWSYERGFVVEGAKTEEFLRETLTALGLTPREYNDFITYWVPQMQENRYNLISFSEEEYDEVAKLSVTPKPDSILRVYMVWKALDEPVQIKPQTITPFERNGFTVVEWGGTELFSPKQ